jgi:tetratricopeptide (TPR) repeat protein
MVRSSVVSWLLLTFLVLAPQAHAGQAPAQNEQQILQSGIQALAANNFEAAELAFSQLVKLDPFAANYEYLSKAEVANRKPDQAVVDFHESIQLGNNSWNVHYNLGLCYTQLHQLQPAIQELWQAISLEPTSLPAEYALGIACCSQAMLRQRFKSWKALDQAPKDTRLWTGLVSAQFQAGTSEQAVATAQNAMHANPENSQLAVVLASACLSHHATQAARNLLEDTLESMPEDTGIRTLLARVSLLAQEPAEALAVLKGMPAGKDRSEKLLVMGEALALMGDLDGATKQLAAALKASPNQVQCLTSYAWVSQLRGQYSDAVPVLSKAARLDPAAAAIQYRVAVSHYFLGRYDMARRACAKALDLDPRYAVAYFLIGMTDLQQKDVAGAENGLHQAVSLAPDVPLFHRELGKVLFEVRNLGDASKELEQVLSLDSKNG